MNEETDARAALEAVRAAQSDMVRRATSQGWYHWALGVLAAVITLAHVAPLALRTPLLGLAICGIAVLVQVYRRRTGVWVGGLRPGRTAWIAAGMGLVVAAGQVFSAWAARSDAPVLGLPAALVVFGLVTALGFAWDAAYRADMEKGR